MENNGSGVLGFMQKVIKHDELPTIKITKLKEAENPHHPNNIVVGFEITGKMLRPLAVGESFYVGYGWATSVVKEILPDNVFKTMNSIYKLEIVNS